MFDEVQALAELVEASQKVTHTVSDAQCFIVRGKLIAYIPPAIVLVRPEQQPEPASERQHVETVGMSTGAKVCGRDFSAAQPLNPTQVPVNLGMTVHTGTGSGGHAAANVIGRDRLVYPPRPSYDSASLPAQRLSQRPDTAGRKPKQQATFFCRPEQLVSAFHAGRP